LIINRQFTRDKHLYSWKALDSIFLKKKKNIMDQKNHHPNM
jgi:hypothetical protein